MEDDGNYASDPCDSDLSDDEDEEEDIDMEGYSDDGAYDAGEEILSSSKKVNLVLRIPAMQVDLNPHCHMLCPPFRLCTESVGKKMS